MGAAGNPLYLTELLAALNRSGGIAVTAQGTGDNWDLRLRGRRGEAPPDVKGDRDADIRLRLYHMRDRNLIPVE
ncbi:MAG TPA: hypothetical protein VN714_28835 [Trebonia sp.]|nr:hypothetical protein [Trebonia sp.]